MKNLFLTIVLLTPVATFAMTCPNGSILDYRVSIQGAISQCGQPSEKTTVVKTVPVTQSWDYYKNTSDGGTIKMTFLINKGIIANIHLKDSSQPKASCETQLVGQPPVVDTTCKSNEKDVTTTNLCGQMINVGSNTQNLMLACGAPALKKDLETEEVNVTELIYPSTTLVFEGDTLVTR